MADGHVNNKKFTRLMAIFQNNVIAGNDDGGSSDNWSYKTFKGPVKLSPPVYQTSSFFTGRMPFLLPNYCKTRMVRFDVIHVHFISRPWRLPENNRSQIYILAAIY